LLSVLSHNSSAAVRLCSYLLLPEERDGLPQGPEHGPDLDVICGDHCGSNAPPQLKLPQELFLLLTLALASLCRGFGRWAVAWLWKWVGRVGREWDMHAKVFCVWGRVFQ